MHYRLRQSKEYWLDVEADSHEQAEAMGEGVPIEEWESSGYSEVEVEEVGDE